MSREEERDPRDLVERLNAGKISRRQFVTRASALGLSAGAIGSILAACGGDDDSAEPAPAEPAEPAPAEPAEPAPSEPAEPAPSEPAEPAPAAPGGTAAEVAVEAAQQFSGTTLNVTWESGLQALDPKEVFGPEWLELTGIEINTIELDNADLFTKGIAEHIAGSGAHDVLNISPAWTADFVLGDVIIPLDDLTAQYNVPADLEDYHPLYASMPFYAGQRYGYFDDGDSLILYYRLDIFEEMGLTPPTTWDEFQTTAQAITDAMAPDVYGAGFWRNPTFQHWSFLPAFQSMGGIPFDAANMTAGINSEQGVEAVNLAVAQNEIAPPGVVDWDPVVCLNAWLEGSLAMMWWWPPPGRWSAGYGSSETALEFLPPSTVVDKVGYAVMPGGNGWHASGFNLAVAKNSPNQEAAYLLIQWITSPEVSLRRVTTPIALRDPYRLSHYTSEEYRSLWPDADKYLETLNNAANVAMTDYAIPGFQDYALSLDKAMTAAYGGADPQGALDTAAGEWEAITDRLGRDTQIEAWNEYLAIPGSSVDNTIEARGEAVTLS